MRLTGGKQERFTLLKIHFGNDTLRDAQGKRVISKRFKYCFDYRPAYRNWAARQEIALRAQGFTPQPAAAPVELGVVKSTGKKVIADGSQQRSYATDAHVIVSFQIIDHSLQVQYLH